MEYNGKKHLTIYGNYIKGADITVLEKYDTIILSPRNLQWIAVNAPHLLHKCYLYVDFFVSPRMHINHDYGFLSCPGDIWPEEEIHELPNWQGAYNYKITWQWFGIFIGQLIQFLEQFTTKHGNIGGIFLDEWKSPTGQSWWGHSAEVMDEVCGQDYEAIREAIESILATVTLLYSDFEFGEGEALIIMNGYERQELDGFRRYFEGAGSSYNPFGEAVEVVRPYDFMQINGDEARMRFLAKWVASKIPSSLGMQPNEEAHYQDIEDPDTW